MVTLSKMETVGYFQNGNNHLYGKLEQLNLSEILTSWLQNVGN